MDLTEFLAARLAEDEAAAKQNLAAFIRFSDAKPGDWTRLMCDPVMGPFGGQTATRDVATGLYVGQMSDPARVLREVEAGRKILAEYTAVRKLTELTGGGDRGWLLKCGWVLKCMAAVWCDHEDYQPEWR